MKCESAISDGCFAKPVWIIVVVMMTVVCTGLASCSDPIESSFDLAPTSRLPKWVTLPPGVQRDDIKVHMDYHTYPDKDGNDTRFFVRNTRDGKTVEMRGRVRDLEPQVLGNAHNEIGGPVPAYEVITVDRVTDIVEHRHMEPIFYMTDDPIVWKALKVNRAAQATH